MKTRSILGRSLASTTALPLAFGLLASATAANAQIDAKQAQEPTTSPLETPAIAKNGISGEGPDSGIVVTGSRIQRSDLTSAAPLTVVTSQAFALQGSANVEAVINQLPSVVPGTTSFSNNPGGGVSTLNLRNLGSQRTLVLVNGRRYMFYSTNQVVDLNTIPTFLIDNVDVVTGGASAVYGSDAIAGVVNFRLRNNLHGLEVGSQYNITGKGDGRRIDAHVALGGSFADDKGHVTVYGEYYQRKPIFQSARGFSQFAFLDDGNGGFVTGGSGTGANGSFKSAVPGVATGTNYAANGPGAIFDTPGGASRLFRNPGDLYNYAPLNYLQVPQERWLLGGYGDYQINDHVTAYTEVTYVNNRVDNALAPTPVTGTFTVDLNTEGKYFGAADLATLRGISARQIAAGTLNRVTNQVLAPGQVNLSVARRPVEAGLREQRDERNAFRALAGLRGDITDKLHYDGYYMFARTRNAQIQDGNVSRRAFQAGLLDGSLNIFGPGTISQAALNAITIRSQNQDISELQVATASVNGELFDLGLGASPIAFAAGFEHRRVASQFVPDTALASGDVVGFNAGQPTSGNYTVTEGFGELNVPIIADRPFFKLLEIHGAARYSHYSLNGVGNVWTYAGDAKWAPIPDITFRGQYQRAIRAPNVGELYQGLAQGFPAATDPCATKLATQAGALRDTCIATGVPAGSLGTGTTLQPNNQIQGAFGGNPNLKAERSTTYTFGGVFSPRFLKRFHVSADYFDITVKGAIATLGGGVNNILNLCYNVIQQASSPYCQAVVRNPANGQIDGSTSQTGTAYVVNVINANIGSFKTRGIDVAADYTQPLGFGLISSSSKLIASFNGTWTDKYIFNFGVGTNTVQCAGKYGNTCGQPQSHYKTSTRVSYVDGPLTLSGQWNHLSAVRDDDPDTVYTTERIGAFDYFNVALSLDITDSYRLTMGVNNVAGRKPPLLGANQEQANTFPSVYDVLGRDFFVSANFKF